MADRLEGRQSLRRRRQQREARGPPRRYEILVDQEDDQGAQLLSSARGSLPLRRGHCRATYLGGIRVRRPEALGATALGRLLGCPTRAPVRGGTGYRRA